MSRKCLSGNWQYSDNFSSLHIVFFFVLVITGRIFSGYTKIFLRLFHGRGEGGVVKHGNTYKVRELSFRPSAQ